MTAADTSTPLPETAAPSGGVLSGIGSVASGAVSAVSSTATYGTWAAFAYFVAYTAYTKYCELNPKASHDDAFTFVKKRMKEVYGWSMDISKEQLVETFTSTTSGAYDYFQSWVTWGKDQWETEDSGFNKAWRALKEAPLTTLGNTVTAAGNYLYNLMGQPQTLEELAPFAASLLMTGAPGYVLGAMGVPFAGGLYMAGMLWNMQLTQANPDLVKNSGAQAISGTAATISAVSQLVGKLPVIGGLIPTVGAYIASISATGLLSPKVMGYLATLKNLDNMGSILGLNVPPLAYAAVMALGDKKSAQKLTGSDSNAPVIDAVSKAVVAAIENAPDAVLSKASKAAYAAQVKAMTDSYTAPKTTRAEAPFRIDHTRLARQCTKEEAKQRKDDCQHNASLMDGFFNDDDFNSDFRPYFPPRQPTEDAVAFSSFSLGKEHHAAELRATQCISGSGDVIAIGHTPVTKDQPVSMPYAETRLLEREAESKGNEQAVLQLEALSLMLLLQTSEPDVHANIETLIHDPNISINIVVDNLDMARLLYHHLQYMVDAALPEGTPPEQRALVLTRLNAQIFMGREQADGRLAAYSSDERQQMAAPLSKGTARLHQRFIKHMLPVIKEHAKAQTPHQRSVMDHVSNIGGVMSAALQGQPDPKTAEVGPSGEKAPRTRTEFKEAVANIASEVYGHAKGAASWAYNEGLPLAARAASSAASSVGSFFSRPSSEEKGRDDAAEAGAEAADTSEARSAHTA